ncbi:MAG: ribonuclease P protein component [Bacteroidia bacterium]
MQSFTKEERLCSKIALDDLFEKGSSFHSFPFKIVWQITKKTIPFQAQVAISVPKRYFKRAVDRNKIKRRIREVYRKNKASFYENLGEKQLLFIIVYTSKTIIEYKELEDRMIVALDRLQKSI